MRKVVIAMRCAIVAYMAIFVLSFAYHCWADPPRRISTDPEATTFIKASVWPISLIAVRNPVTKAWATIGLVVFAVVSVSFVAGFGAGVRESGRSLSHAP